MLRFGYVPLIMAILAAVMITPALASAAPVRPLDMLVNSGQLGLHRQDVHGGRVVPAVLRRLAVLPR